MKIYVDNQGVETEKPNAVGPCQSLAERMNLDEPQPITAGALSAEHRAILSSPESMDRREFNFLIESGLGMDAAFKAAASGSLDVEVNELCKSFGVTPDKKQVRIERDQLDDGTWSVSEYDLASGRLLRAYFSSDGELPEAMRR